MKEGKNKRQFGFTEEGKRWLAQAIYHEENKAWLRYSGKIASRIHAALSSQEGMTQKKLAELMDVSPQQISKIMKGHENLTLQTIAKLSEVLKVDLITFPEYTYSVRTEEKSLSKKSNNSVRLIKS